jgi:excinuclease ABC subunit C
MVVFVDGRPSPKEYRRFKIRTVEGADDFASMAEVLSRRFKKATAPAEKDGAVGADGPAPEGGHSPTAHGQRPQDVLKAQSWQTLPDLLIVDGGKGQLNAALDVMRDLGVEHVPAAGLAKRNEELFVKDMEEPIVLPSTSQALYLVQRVRDEAHRFAITYHRKLRAKRSVQSALDAVPGVGPNKKKALLRKFGSVKGVREADVDDIAATPGFTRTLAAKVKELV